ncbi:MAG: glucosaminidase domain-containing protein [Actinomycetaceae bacterium]|nr:glucosaminidase domain-containing protein [Actinomycetaceae bacterium]
MVRKLCVFFALVPLVWGSYSTAPAFADDSDNTEATQQLGVQESAKQADILDDDASAVELSQEKTQPSGALGETPNGAEQESQTRSAQSVSAQIDVYSVYNPRTTEHLYTRSVLERDTLVGKGWYDEGIAWRSPASSQRPAYRLFNPANGMHLYTADAHEVSVLSERGWKNEGILCYGNEEDKSIAVYRFRGEKGYVITASETQKDKLASTGWVSEGIAFYASGEPAEKPWPEGAPAVVTDEKVYRLYYAASGEHLYTASMNEAMVLTRRYWKLEGIAWTSPTWSQIPVYRLFLPESGGHHYTADLHEVDLLTSVHGWKNEGVAWYSEQAKTVPVYRQFHPQLRASAHNYTTDAHEYEVNNSIHGWIGENIAWYVSGKGWSDGAIVVNRADLAISLDDMARYQLSNPYYANNYTEADLRGYLDPDKVSPSSDENYQFLDLRSYTGMGANDINAFISSNASGRKGTLAGMGHVFVQASQTYQINEAYLVAHAVLESGWGTSQLAQGYYYDGTTPINGKTYPAGTYYNFFGIGAVDSNALGAGRATAVANGWDSREKAILGGAQWISSNYIHRSTYPQPTLYAMKWDYERSSATRARGWHQYATDVKWPQKIARLTKSAYSYSSSSAALSFIVPKYR